MRFLDVLRLGALALLTFVSLPGCAENPENPLPVLPPMVESRVDEPVFQGSARIYEFNRGAPETVVLVHGINGEGLRDFGRQIPELARRYHVITFDLPGFGESERKNALYSPENYAAFVRFVTEGRARRPFHLVGHSMGGAIAIAYAATYPADVRRLVAIDVAGILHRVAMSKYMARQYAADATGTDPDGVLGKIAGKLVEDLGKISFKADQLLNSPRMRGELGGAAQVAGIALLEEDFGPLLPRVKAPTLLLWGGEDGVAPLRTGQLLNSQLADARLEVIDGAGHVPMRDAPREVSRHLAEFLAGAGGAGGVRAPLPAMGEGRGRVGRCEDERGKRFEGAFERIEIRGCAGVVIQNARVESLSLFESRVEIIDSELRGDALALQSVGAELRMTGGAIVGRVAIEADRSSLDLAGVRVVGTDAAVRVKGESSLVFSVSRVDSPQRSGSIHTFLNLAEGAKL